MQSAVARPDTDADPEGLGHRQELRDPQELGVPAELRDAEDTHVDQRGRVDHPGPTPTPTVTPLPGEC